MEKKSPPTGLPTTERSLPMALIRARERVMAPVRVMLQETGITEQQWRVLRVLSEYGAQDGTELAKRAGLLLPSLTRITRALEERGLISKSVDATDRRKQIILITQKGADIIESKLDEAAAIYTEYRRILGQEQYDLLLDMLARLERFDMAQTTR